MIQTLSIIRILTLSYLCFLIRITNYWPMTVLPLILRYNLHIESDKAISNYLSAYFSSFYYGGIVGAFIWPYITNHLSKRNCILISLILQGLFNTLSGSFDKFWLICFFRFLIGFSYNLNTVGKAFLLEICEEQYQQYAFTIEMCFSLFGVFVSPLLGYKVYTYTGYDYKATCLYLLILYVTGFILFVLFFYVISIKKTLASLQMEDDLKLMKADVTGFYGFRLHCSDDPDYERVSVGKNKSIKRKNMEKRKQMLDKSKITAVDHQEVVTKPTENIDEADKEEGESYIPANRKKVKIDKKKQKIQSDRPLDDLQDEEMQKLINTLKPRRKRNTGIFDVLKAINKPSLIRSLLIVHILMTALHKVQMFLSVLYLEMKVNKGGFGISAAELSYLSVICYIPSLIILLVSPRFVPSKIRYFTYIKTIIVFYGILFMLIPILKDTAEYLGPDATHVLVILDQGLSISISPRIFAPFITYLINKGVKKSERTAINAINYIFSTFFSALFLNIIIYIYSITVVETTYDHWFFNIGSKYIVFIIFALCIVYTNSLLK